MPTRPLIPVQLPRKPRHMMCGAISPKFGRGSRDEGSPAPPANGRNSSQPAAASSTGRPTEEHSVHGLRAMPCLKFSACTARARVAVLDFTVRPFSLLKFQLDAGKGHLDDEQRHFRAPCPWPQSHRRSTTALPFVNPFPSGLNIYTRSSPLSSAEAKVPKITQTGDPADAASRHC